MNPQKRKRPSESQSVNSHQTSPERRRLNVRGLILMGLILGVSVPGVVVLRYWQTHAQRSTLLKQAKEFREKRDTVRSLSYLNKYLEKVPNSAEGLSLKADILAETAVTNDMAAAALQVNEQAIRALGSKATLAMRRRSVELNLRMTK